jgi:hypothetical protein
MQPNGLARRREVALEWVLLSRGEIVENAMREIFEKIVLCPLYTSLTA